MSGIIRQKLIFNNLKGKIMGELTRQQKEAIAWVDVAAGLASASAGPISFLIAAAASMAYYKDKVANDGWRAIATEEPTLPSTSNNQGILHNLTCEKYLTDGYDQVTYSKIVITAIQVRPDLADPINSMSEDYFNQKVQQALQENLVSVDDKLNVILNTVPLNGANSDILLQSLHDIDNSITDDERKTNVQSAINMIPSFALNNNDKSVLTNAFEVLQHSYQLWSK